MFESKTVKYSPAIYAKGCPREEVAPSEVWKINSYINDAICHNLACSTKRITKHALIICFKFQTRVRSKDCIFFGQSSRGHPQQKATIKCTGEHGWPGLVVVGFFILM